MKLGPKLALALATTTLLGCALDNSDPHQGEVDQQIVGGVRTSAHPEVGRLYNIDTSGACTATLIAERVIITAAHCFDYGNWYDPSTTAPHGWRFQFEFSWDGGDHVDATYMVRQWHSFGGTLGSTDIAIGVLSGAPPVAPASIGTSVPNLWETITLYGYGCTSHTAGDGGRKHESSALWLPNGNDKLQGPNLICPGDSGGPWFNAAGQIIGVSSSWSEPDMDDCGNVPAFASTIGGYQNAWRYGPPVALQGANGNWATAEGGGGGDVNVNRTAIGPWETFSLQWPAPGNWDADTWFGFRTYNGHYITAEYGGGSNVIANRTALGGWEAFTAIPNSFHTALGFLTSNGHYLCSEYGGGYWMTANRAAMGGWEQFGVAGLAP